MLTLYGDVCAPQTAVFVVLFSHTVCVWCLTSGYKFFIHSPNSSFIILWLVDLLLGNGREIRNYTTAVAN
jgi:hypothetical protein